MTHFSGKTHSFRERIALSRDRAGIYKYRAPTEIFFGIYDTAGSYMSLRTVSMCWCTSASRRKECKSFLSRIVQLHEMCPALSRMQIISVFTARYRRKRTSKQLPANGIPMVAIFFFFKWYWPRIPVCPVSLGHADAAGCNLGTSSSSPELERHKRLLRSLRKAGNVMDYKLLQSPRNRPGPSLFGLRSRTSLLSGLPREYNYTMFGGRTSPSGRQTEQMSPVASHILQVIKHCFLCLCILFKYLFEFEEFCQAICLLIKQFMFLIWHYIFIFPSLKA